MRETYQNRAFFLLALLSAAFLANGCQPTTTTPTTGNTANTTAANANSSNSNAATAANSTAPSSAAIETREPEQYQAVVTVKVETMGEQQQNKTLPALSANVARNGADRRMEFNLPNGEKVIYLDRADKRYIISPTRKQYAEVNQEAVGMDVRRVMTPGQLVEQAKNLKGVVRVGEEQLNGRAVVRYRYGAVTDTKTQAGNVNTESFMLVDKETGLPLRSETVSQSQSGGNVQGVTGLRLVTEMSNIQNAAPPELFAEPTDYKKVAPEEVRGQLNALMQVAGAVLGQVLQNNAQQPAQPAATPAATPKP